MNRLSRCVALAGLACLSLLHEPAVAQDQTLKIVYPFSAGGSGDAIARVVAEHLQKSLGRPVIIENKTGAGGRIGAQAVKELPPDGDTLLLAAGPQLTLQPHVLNNLGYDPFADFVPIARIAKFDLAVAVSGKIRPRSIKELAAWLTADPDQAVFGSPGAGTAGHFAAMTLARTFDLSARHVFYRGTPAVLPDLLEGRVPIYIASNAELLEHEKRGGIRILATTGAERSIFSPDAPTLKESGVAFEASGWFAFYAPAYTPPQVTERLEKAIVAAALSPELAAKMQTLGFQPTDTTAQDLKRVQRAEFGAWADIVKSFGFKPE